MSKILFSLVVLSLIVPTSAFAQIAELPTGAENTTILANGTIVQNLTASPPPMKINLCPDNDFDGKCGVETAIVVNRCPDNNHDYTCEWYTATDGVWYPQGDGPFNYYTIPAPIPTPAPMAQILVKQPVRESNDDDDNNNNRNDDDNNRDDKEEKTYCDVPNRSNPCHDRRDVSDITGLATCMDGTHEEDWRDCKGGGSEDDNDDNNNDKDDDLPNCNDVEYGTRCDGTEDEDSWTDDEVEVEEESNDEEEEDENEGTYEDDGYLDEEAE